MPRIDSGDQTVNEQTFFQHEDVLVTNTRFVNGGHTYAMSNVTSVKAFEQKPKRFWGIVLLIIGLGIALDYVFPGLLMAGAAGYSLHRQKTRFHVMLATASGEVSALSTHQREYLDKVVSAVNQAIIYRG